MPSSHEESDVASIVVAVRRFSRPVRLTASSLTVATELAVPASKSPVVVTVRTPVVTPDSLSCSTSSRSVPPSAGRTTDGVGSIITVPSAEMPNAAPLTSVAAASWAAAPSGMANMASIAAPTASLRSFKLPFKYVSSLSFAVASLPPVRSRLRRRTDTCYCARGSQLRPRSRIPARGEGPCARPDSRTTSPFLLLCPLANSAITSSPLGSSHYRARTSLLCGHGEPLTTHRV